uniref:Ribosome biogenesis protein NOP53 n=1 Tax=Helianthus annuus TaxID=4232 RepID=A0A251UZD6_HELAN
MLDVSWNVRVSNKDIVIPAVEVEPPGCSYNPSSESHQDSLAQAVIDEMQKVYTKELRPTPVPLTIKGGVIDEEDGGITLNCLRELMQNRILLFFIS